MSICLTYLCLYIIWYSGMYIYLKMQPEKFLAHEGWNIELESNLLPLKSLVSLPFQGPSWACHKKKRCHYDNGYQAPPSMGFFRQEYWSGVPLPSPLKCTLVHAQKNCLGRTTWACYHGDFKHWDVECGEGHIVSLLVFFYIIWIFQTWPWHVLIRKCIHMDYINCVITGIFTFSVLYIV